MASLRSDAGLSAADLRRREFGAAEAGRRGGGGAERGASKKGQKPERHRYMHTVVVDRYTSLYFLVFGVHVGGFLFV